MITKAVRALAFPVWMVVILTALIVLPRSVPAADESNVFPVHSLPPPAAPTPKTDAQVLPNKPEAQTTEAPPENAMESGMYKIQPGDLLAISVWKETDLQMDVLVRPDGGFSFPLAGDVQAAGRSVDDVRVLVDQRLRKYISDPVVTVAIKQIGGSRIFVVGKVNKPGEYQLLGPTDVMQALGLAGGSTPFASLNDIRILRRNAGKQTAISFRYHDIESGKALEQNVLLHSGDTVVVP